MYIIGENIHIISQAVKDALRDRDREYFKESAQKQVEAGAKCVDINMGPRKKDWEEVFPWMVQSIETVVDVPLCIDTTNVFGMEAALKTVTKAQPILNSTSAEAERLEKVPELAKKYGAKVIVRGTDPIVQLRKRYCAAKLQLAEAMREKSKTQRSRQLRQILVRCTELLREPGRKDQMMEQKVLFLKGRVLHALGRCSAAVSSLQRAARG